MPEVNKDRVESDVTVVEGEIIEEKIYELDDELREVLGEEISVSNAPVKINDNLKKWWEA